MRCPECGSELGQGDKFCFNCGAPIKETPEAKKSDSSICPYCGEPISEDDKFCGSCGHELQRSKIIERPKTETTNERAARNPHPFMTFLGNANFWISTLFIILGGLGLNKIPTKFMKEEIGFFLMFWGVFQLIAGTGVFGGYLLTRKQPVASRHGKVIIFRSLFMVGVFLIAFFIAFIRFA